MNAACDRSWMSSADRSRSGACESPLEADEPAHERVVAAVRRVRILRCKECVQTVLRGRGSRRHVEAQGPEPWRSDGDNQGWNRFDALRQVAQPLFDDLLSRQRRRRRGHASIIWTRYAGTRVHGYDWSLVALTRIFFLEAIRDGEADSAADMTKNVDQAKPRSTDQSYQRTRVLRTDVTWGCHLSDIPVAPSLSCRSVSHERRLDASRSSARRAARNPAGTAVGTRSAVARTSSPDCPWN